jgi:hypothetical protein
LITLGGFQEAKQIMQEDPSQFKELVQESLRRHVKAINVLVGRGMKFWDYGNSFLLEVCFGFGSITIPIIDFYHFRFSCAFRRVVLELKSWLPMEKPSATLLTFKSLWATFSHLVSDLSDVRIFLSSSFSSSSFAFVFRILFS